MISYNSPLFFPHGCFENSFHVCNFFPFSAIIHASPFFFLPSSLHLLAGFVCKLSPPFMLNDQLQFTSFSPPTHTVTMKEHYSWSPSLNSWFCKEKKEKKRMCGTSIGPQDLKANIKDYRYIKNNYCNIEDYKYRN